MKQIDPGRELDHTPVLYQEIIHALQPSGEGKFVDGTLGTGGHAFGLLEASEPSGMLLGLDLDPQALEIAQKKLSKFGSRAILVQASYTSLEVQLDRVGWDKVQGILLDLGYSSLQIEQAERGFSFLLDGPLDMRFDRTAETTASDLVNHLPESELAEILYKYGEERRARALARAIVKARPIESTRGLAAVVEQASPIRKGKIHPATRTFQALRIAVNGELDSLQAVLPHALRRLAPTGRLAVISFHSLEDRIVKRYFQQESRDCICPPGHAICTCGHLAQIKLIHKKPITASKSEVQKNPRSRSAKLRIAEKVGTDAA